MPASFAWTYRPPLINQMIVIGPDGTRLQEYANPWSVIDKRRWDYLGRDVVFFLYSEPDGNREWWELWQELSSAQRVCFREGA